MRKNSIQFQLLSFIVSIGMFLLLLNYIYSHNSENILRTFVKSFKFTEFQFKFMIIIPIIVFGYFNKQINFSKKIDLNKIYIYSSISLVLFFLPIERLSFLGAIPIIILYILSYIVLSFSSLQLGAYYYSASFERDQFNLKNQTFEQTKEKIETPYSVNIKSEFYFNERWNKGWINIVNVFTGTWVYGLMGAGKSYTIFSQAIYQLLNKEFSLAIYDFKFPIGTEETYNIHKAINPKTSFYYMNMNDIRYHKCNPIEPKYIPSIQDMETVSNIIIKGLGKDKTKYDPFFDGSAQGYFTALQIILKKWERKYDLKVCSIPHATILASIKIDYVLPVLLDDKDVLMQVTSFRSAFDNESSSGQLSGQISSLANKLRSLVSPEMMYLMSGESDFSLDLNNPDDPKILSIGADQEKDDVTAPLISLYFEMISKLTNVENKSNNPFMLILDEFPRLFFPSLSSFLSTGRSNKCGVMAGAQGIPQLEENFSHSQAKAILDIQGTIIAGGCGNETAKYISERIGKTNQIKTNITESETAISINHTTEKDYLIPSSRISDQGVGEFAGTVVDDYDNIVSQKRFMGKLLMDDKVKDCLNKYKLPKVIDFKNDRMKKNISFHKEEIKKHHFIEKLLSLFKEEEINNSTLAQNETPFKYYMKFLLLDKNELEELRKKLLINEFETEDSKIKLTELIYLKLEEVVYKNEISFFLDKYINNLYSEVEYCLRLEYKELTGFDIYDDLYTTVRKNVIIRYEEETIF